MRPGRSSGQGASSHNVSPAKTPIMANDTQNPNPPEEQPSGVPSGNRGDTVRASWYVSLDDLRKAVSNSSEHAQELIVWCYLWCIDDGHPVSLAEGTPPHEAESPLTRSGCYLDIEARLFCAYESHRKCYPCVRNNL